MEEWKEYKLGDVCTIVGRIGFRGYTTDDLTNNPKDGAITLSPTNIVQGEIDLSKPTYIKWPKYYESPEIMLNSGDIVLVKTGSSIGRTAYIRRIDHPMTLNPQFVVLKNININPIFLAYVVKTPHFQALLKTITVGSAIPTLSQKNLGNLKIHIPNKQYQFKVASLLKSLDDKIEVNRRINNNLEQQAQALFKSWFVDFEPFKDQFFVESEFGMIPQGWRVGDLYEYIDVIYGAPYKSSLFNDNKDGLPLIRIRDLKTNAPQFYTPEILPNTEYIEAGDIVAGMDAEFIPYVWVGEKGVLNQRCCKFKAKNDAISNYYILFLVKPELEYVQSYKTGTTVSHLGKSDIDRFKFITPPLDVVLSFSEIVDPLKIEVVNRSKESRRLATLRDTLLPRLMSGELSVNDIKEYKVWK
jgi:type I restriction enzyme S subunit